MIDALENIAANPLHCGPTPPPPPPTSVLPQRRIAEGAAMLRTKGEAGTGNVVEAVRHGRTVQREIKMVSGARAVTAGRQGFWFRGTERHTYTHTLEENVTAED